MNRKQISALGFSGQAILKAAEEAVTRAGKAGLRREAIKSELQSLHEAPSQYTSDPHFGALARLLLAPAERNQSYKFNQVLSYKTWGENIDEGAHEQMQNACRLPVSVKGALMADAHIGYGLPIGGVLATEGAVIPYAVGVDIACRVMLSILNHPLTLLHRDRTALTQALEHETSFGVGAVFSRPKQHPVLDEDWEVTPVTGELKDSAWRQLGTSGSGNHFVEFGELELLTDFKGLAPGKYLGLVSHSGSRGPGARVADYYSRLARELHPGLPRELQHLAWLDLDNEGAEYWAAMELMGKFASANHHIIHRDVLHALNAEALVQVENHHNFAWKEEHEGKSVIVHRKGATPAGKGVVGYIPGTMIAPGYLVEGIGSEAALDSASHGAGRAMSRKAAKKSTTVSALRKVTEDHGVTLLSAGLDESPHAYKDINEVMRAQADLVRTLGKFTPKIVKMAAEGERAED